MTATFYRSRQGDRVHVASCHWAWRGQPWEWAEGRPLTEVRSAIRQFNYETCTVCRPLEVVSQ